MNFIFKPRLHEVFLSTTHNFVHLVTFIDNLHHSCNVQRKAGNGIIEYGFISQNYLGKLKSLGVVTLNTFYI